MVLEKLSYLAVAVRYMFYNKKTYQKGVLKFIRMTYDENTVKVSDADILVFLDRVAVRDITLLNEMNSSNFLFTRDVLEKSFMTNEEKAKVVLTDDFITVDLKVLEILELLKEAELSMSMMMFNFEVFSERSLNVLKLMTNYRISFPLTGVLNEKHIHNDAAKDSMKILTEMRNTVAKIMDMSDSYREKEVEKNIYDNSTHLSNFLLEFQSNFNERTLKVYMKSRHEIVVRLVQEKLNIAMEDSDVKVTERFGYYGLDSHLTPDLIYEDPNTNIMHIIDVAVTKSRADIRAEAKESYYGLLAEELSIHLNRDVTTDAVVISLKDSEETYLPSFLSDFREDFSKLKADLIKIDNFVREIPNYEEILAAFETKTVLEKFREKNEALAMMNSLSLKLLTISGKKAADMKESFTKMPSDIFPEFTTTNEDQMINRMKSEYKSFNENDYLKTLLEQVNAQMAEGKEPKNIEKLFKEKNIAKTVEEETRKGEEIRRRFKMIPNAKIPKTFKFPNLTMNWGKEPVYVLNDFGTVWEQLDDGTKRYRMKVDYADDEKIISREGLGINVEEDTMDMGNLLMYLSSESNNEFRAKMMDTYPNAPRRMQEMFKLKIYEVAYAVKELAMNIAYLEGRRFNDSSKFTVSKEFPELGYTLCIAAGSRLTSENQIRYKVFTNYAMSLDKNFHSIDDNNAGSCESKWITVSTTDLKTMTVMFEKVVSVASHYLDCLEESRESSSFSMRDALKSKVIMMPQIILMEMKRGTSTTSQYNRYILNSMMGYVSDQEKAVADIMSEPVRSRVEAYVRISQLDWALRLSMRSKKIWFSSFMKKISTERDYDTLHCPAIYDSNEDMEFCVQMNDIYHGNLFQKEAGFISHRSKAIIEKTMSAEKEFLETRNMDTMNADMSVEDCFDNKDKKHIYSKEFVMLMGKKAAKKIKSNPKYNEVMLSKMYANMHDTMMMTYSLMESRVPTQTLCQSREQKTQLTFLTMLELIEEFGTSTTIGMISRDNMIEAVFSMFPKAQIGGPREILIQSYRMRLHVKFMENFFEGLCTLHPKEMLTKGALKENIQSTTAADHKKKCISSVVKRKRFPMPATLVADASRWAPSFVMHMFSHFLIAMELPEDLEDHFLAVLKSFSSKISMLPKSLRKKWDKKPMNQEEEEEVMEWTRRMGESSDHTVRIFSGMGQGMLHKFSSFLHCAKDDILDDLYRAVESMTDITIESTTMISSDDLMKQIFITTRDPKVAFQSLKRFMTLYEVTNMLSNIHTNWKKTSLSFLIDEFNSYFSTGKRATMAVIKDVFTAIEIVDMTEPLTAVRTVVSNISRAFRNGLYLNTAEIMFFLMRVHLIQLYAIKDHVIEQLMEIFDCNEQMLPSDLGFLSTDHILGQLIFGNDILMFREENTDTLNMFYRKVFTGLKAEAKDLISNDYLSAISGRIKLTLPYRVDKNLSKLKDHAFTKLSLDMEKVMTRNESISLYAEEGYTSCANMINFINNYFVGTERKYEFSTSMTVNSMVRALQYGGNNLKTTPDVKADRVFTVVGFVNMILDRDHSNSSIMMMEPYSLMMSTIHKAETNFRSVGKSEGKRHNKRAVLRFRTRDLVMSADTKEIISFITGESTKVSNRILRVIKDITAMFSMDYNNFLENPVKEISETLTDLKYPFAMFRKVVEYYVSTRVNFSVDFMCSFLDKGNALDNILSIYCDRRDPACLYTLKMKGSFTNIAHDINTWMALGGSIKDVPWESAMSMMDQKAINDNRYILTSDGPLERMAKIMYSTYYKNEYPVSDFVFHRTAVLSHTSFVHTYFDFKDLAIVVTDNLSCTHYINLIGDNLHERKESVVMQLARFDMNNIEYADYKRVYWNSLDYTVEPTISSTNFGYKCEESTMTNKWEFKIMVKWEKGSMETKNIIYINVASDNYTITNDSLYRMLDEEKVSDFVNMQMMEPDIYMMQNMMIKNKIYSKSKFGKMSKKMKAMEKADSMSEEVMAFTANIHEDDPLEILRGVDLQGIFDMLLEGITMEPTVDEDLMMLNLDEDMVTTLNQMLDEESKYMIHQTPAWERKSMNSFISDIVTKFVDTEVAISMVKIHKLFNRAKQQDTADKVWSIVATELTIVFKDLEEFMCRILLAVIYKVLSRNMNITRPMNVCIIDDYQMPKEPIITSTSVEEYSEFLEMLSDVEA